MKKKLFSLLLSAMCTGAIAQIPTIVWEKSLGGSYTDNASSIVQTSDGGYISAGQTQSNDGDVSGNHAPSNYDIWVTKVSNTGSLQWQKCLGGSFAEDASTIRQTFDGGYVVAGFTASTDGDVSGCHGGEDFWIVKLSSSGNILWQKCLGGSGYEECHAMEQTTDSGFILTGYSTSSDGDVTGHHGSGDDMWVVKLSSNGTLQWQKSLGGTGNDGGYAIAQTANGEYIVAGFTSSTDGDVTGTHYGGDDYWVVKLSATGTILWQKSYGGSQGEYVNSIKQTLDGGYILTGFCNSSDGIVIGHHTVPLAITADMWTLKLNSTGDIEWQRSLGGTGDDYGNAVAQLSDSTYLVFGHSNSNDGDVTNNHGNSDYWLAKLTSSGTLLWQKTFGGSLNDAGISMQPTADGGYILTGQSNSNDDDVTGNHPNSLPFGGPTSPDVWIVKLSCDYPIQPFSITRTGAVLSTTIPFTTYQWRLAGIPITGATNATYTALTSGAYDVVVTNGSGCTGISSADTITVTSGVSSFYNSTAISVFPNPAQGTIFIDGVDNATIRVYNVVGQLVNEAVNTNTISIEGLAAGVYFIKVFNSNAILLAKEKIIKN